MAEHPAALQLRLLQTVVEVAAEKNSTLVLPFPVELLRFLERGTPSGETAGTAERPPVDAAPNDEPGSAAGGRCEGVVGRRANGALPQCDPSPR